MSGGGSGERGEKIPTRVQAGHEFGKCGGGPRSGVVETWVQSGSGVGHEDPTQQVFWDHNGVRREDNQSALGCGEVIGTAGRVEVMWFLDIQTDSVGMTWKEGLSWNRKYISVTREVF